MSRRTTHTTATLHCAPCGIYRKEVIALDDTPAILCTSCGHYMNVHIAGIIRTNIFPYVTTHLGGTPTTIDSLHHLRTLERTEGFVAPAFSQNRSNLDYPLMDAPVSRRTERHR